MSNDMFSNMTERNIESYRESYRDIEFEKWKKYSEKCTLKKDMICRAVEDVCLFDRCHDWKLINYIKFGSFT